MDADNTKRNQGSTSAFVAMMACNVILLLMLAACSPPARAQVLALQTRGVDAGSLGVVVSLERLTVQPSPEDLPAPAKGRWQRFEEALNATQSRNHRIFESATNNWIRMSCHEPCVMNCCASTGGFSLAGRGVGR